MFGKLSQIKRYGFTLSELLIALGILAVIATFTIPKILLDSQNRKYSSIAKETMSSIAQAYQLYRSENNVTSSTVPKDFLKPYLNYISEDTTSWVDRDFGNGPAGGHFECSVANPCYRMHSGAVIFSHSGSSFGGTTYLNAVSMMIDQDGEFTGKMDGMWVYLYYDGMINDGQWIRAGSSSSAFALYELNQADWFSWN